MPKAAEVCLKKKENAARSTRLRPKSIRREGLQSSSSWKVRILPDSPPVYRAAKHFDLIHGCSEGSVQALPSGLQS